MNNISDWLNRTNYTAEERRHMCVQLLSEAQYWDVHQYLKMMHDSTKRPWVGLTDGDISEIVRGTHNTGSFVRAIEAKLKEKNT